MKVDASVIPQPLRLGQQLKMNIESYSTNEVAINWNAPLAWVAAFLDDVQGRAPVAAARP